jgi:hypothetical protein
VANFTCEFLSAAVRFARQVFEAAMFAGPSGFGTTVARVALGRFLQSGGSIAMTTTERELMTLLCQRIQQEDDPKKFGGLVNQLDELLSTKEERLAGKQQESV